MVRFNPSVVDGQQFNISFKKVKKLDLFFLM